MFFNKQKIEALEVSNLNLSQLLQRLTQTTRENIDLISADLRNLQAAHTKLMQKLEALEKKSEKPIAQKSRNQKKRIMKIIKKNLALNEMTLNEIMELLEHEGADLKKSTIGVYLSTDKELESSNGKWRLLQKSNAAKKDAVKNAEKIEKDRANDLAELQESISNLPNSGE